jgi:hypothetical protein
MDKTHQQDTGLPIRHSFGLTYLIALIITLIMAIASVVGIIFRSTIYPTEDLYSNFMPNDVVNLLIGVPILLGSMWLTYRGRLIGLLFWPGALLYVLYNYIAYLFALPFNQIFLLYLSLVTLSVYTIIAIVANIDGPLVKGHLSGHVPERLAGGVISGVGLLFLVRVLGVVILAVTDQSGIERVELSVLIADFLISPAMISGGILLWQQKGLGYVSGTGLLFQLSMLFIGLIIFMILQPLISAAQFNLIDVVIVLIMGLVCFIPFGLFVRGVNSAGVQPG